MRKKMLTTERALVLTGILLAGGAASFATLMLTDRDHVPVFPGGEHLAIFSQPATRLHDRPLVARAPASLINSPLLVDPMPVGSLPDSGKPPGTPSSLPVVHTLAGFSVRGIYGGKAMVQTADGFMMVEPGKVIPGAGEVQRIERHGQEWVIITSEGIIGQTAH